MQTENGSEEFEMSNSEQKSINNLKGNEMKKKLTFVPPKGEPRDTFVPPKGEPRDDDQSLPQPATKKCKSVNSTNGDETDELLNGVLDISETFSDDESENSYQPKEKRIINSTLKKEELTEVKILDEPEEMLINEDEDLMFPNGSNGQFPFDLNTNDQLSGDFLDDDNTENPLAECQSDTTDNETAERGTNEDGTETNDNAGDADDDEDDGSLQKENDENDGCDSLQNAESTGNESNAEEDTNKSETSGNVSESNDSVETEKNTETKSNDEVDKDTESEIQESKRPSSRESTTSTTSNCSERTLTIRSASDLNKLVMSANEALVKKEKISHDSSSEVEQVPEKPHGGLSILNPSQLGASISGGENLLQNMNFAQPNDQMNVMGYLQNNTVPLQCDVCETQFPDNILLEEHKANAGHYKCHLTPECAALIFQSLAEVSTHQQSVHGVIPQSPVQQLAHQVQSLPIRYQMDQSMSNSFSSMAQFPATSPQPRAVGPQVYPPAQNNLQMRGYMQTSPRLQIGTVRGNVPMLPQSSPSMKRSSTTLPQPRMTPPKRGRMDYSNRNGDADCKVVSIQKPDNTDDVVAQLSKSITITARQDTQKKSDTAAVTNMLANRGITVSSVPAKQNRNSSAVQMLNLNSAVSLIPTNAASNRQGRTNGRPAPAGTPNRMTTVDLTGPDPPRNRQTNRTNRFQCQICDRTFFNQDQLNQHMITHRNVARKQLPYKCNQCTAQYPTQQGLQQHKQTFHRDSVPSTNEMVIPIVDLKQPGSLQKLNAIGIHHMIPLNALGQQSANGTFGIPVLPLSSDRTVASNLSNCAITNILPVGPLKTLGR